VGNTSINLQLVREGRAVVYRDYLSGCPNTQDFLSAEAQARDARLAFWSQDNPVMPWDWRRGDRTATTSPPPSLTVPNNNGTCDPSYPGTCIPPAPPDLDCGDITDRRTSRPPPLRRRRQRDWLRGTVRIGRFSGERGAIAPSKIIL